MSYVVNPKSALATVYFIFLAFPALAVGDAAIDSAKSFFARYVQLGESFNPELAELYSDTAVIRAKRVYPNGQTQEMQIPSVQYKELIRNAMPLAQAHGDVSKFDKVTYSREGDKIRISARRYSVLKDYYSPYSMLVSQDSNKKWLIVEEIVETQP